MSVTINNLQIKTVSETENFGEYSFEPLPTGFGYTLANALRRVLLTSIKGSAPTQVRIKGVNHQFTSVEGVKEDIVEITLNLKKLRFKNHSENPAVVTLSKTGAGKVSAKDFDLPADVELMNEDTHVATLSGKSASLEIELIVENGVGYSPMEERKTSKVGVIVLDALFSPITKTSYTVEPTRFGDRTDLDKIVIRVETDGSISPRGAIKQAAGLVKEYYQAFEIWEAPGDAETEEPESTTTVVVEDIHVEELPLQTRTVNALKKGGVTSLRDLADKSPEELADIKNLGEKSLKEINKLLIKEGLRAAE
jgi:DNA-directed RNA polymerase subunit alpha